jgi:hypothetical protein
MLSILQNYVLTNQAATSHEQELWLEDNFVLLVLIWPGVKEQSECMVFVHHSHQISTQHWLPRCQNLDLVVAINNLLICFVLSDQLCWRHQTSIRFAHCVLAHHLWQRMRREIDKNNANWWGAIWHGPSFLLEDQDGWCGRVSSFCIRTTGMSRETCPIYAFSPLIESLC